MSIITYNIYISFDCQWTIEFLWEIMFFRPKFGCFWTQLRGKGWTNLGWTIEIYVSWTNIAQNWDKSSDAWWSLKEANASINHNHNNSPNHQITSGSLISRLELRQNDPGAANRFQSELLRCFTGLSNFNRFHAILLSLERMPNFGSIAM